MSIYQGFSTTKKGFALTDKELVNRDLLNSIMTAKGERVMNPSIGTIIPLIAFEPLDQITLTQVEDDLRAAVAADPRLALIDIAVLALPDNNAIVALLDLQYLQLNVKDTLRLEFPTSP